MRSLLIGAMVLCLTVVGVACSGGDDDPAGAAAEEAASSSDESSGESEPSDDASAGDESSEAESSGGAGTLTLGDEVISLDRARCFLEEQDAAGVGGKILFTAQGFGMTGDGADFVLDISRFDEDGMSPGDKILVDVGDPRGEDFYSWNGNSELGTIERDGSTLRADGLSFRHSEDGSAMSGAFEVRC